MRKILLLTFLVLVLAGASAEIIIFDDPTLKKPLTSIIIITLPNITIIEPEGITYSYTLDIPMDLLANNQTTCWWTIDGGIINNTISCVSGVNYVDNFDVDFNGDYTFTAYAQSSDGTANDSVTFTVNNNFSTGKATNLSMSMFLILGLAFYMLRLSDKVKNSKLKLKPLFFMIAILCSFATVRFAMILANEYIKLPSLYRVLDIFSFAIIIAIFVPLLFYYILTYIQTIVDRKVVTYE